MADTTTNKQFSVMVDDSGVLSYPQNFITTNQLAKFGSEVVGTLKSLNTTRVSSLTGTEYIEFTSVDESGNTDSTISFYTYDDASIKKYFEINAALARLNIPYGNIELESHDNISLNSTDGYIKLASYYGVILNSSEGSFSMNMPEGNTIIQTGGLTSILATKETGAVEIGVGHGYFDMSAPGTLSNNIVINKDKIAVSAPLVELPSNTTIGGATPATFGNNVVGMLKQLAIMNPVDENNPSLTVMGVNNKFANFIDGNNDIVIIDGMGHTSQTGLAINNIGSGNAITVNGSTVDAIIEINSANIKSSGSFIKINGGSLYENSGIITVEGIECSNSGIFNINNCTNLGPIITVDGEDYLAQFAKKTDVQGKLSFYQEITSLTGPANIATISAEYIKLEGSNGTSIEVDGYNSQQLVFNASPGVTGTAIATTIGTSEESSKLPTEGAIVKALKNVSGGSAPDLSNYLKKSGDTTLELGEFANQDANGELKIYQDDPSTGTSAKTTTITGDNVQVAYADGPQSNLKAGILELFNGLDFTITIDSDKGFSGLIVDTTIPSTPVAGHIATTGAIKTYVDTKVASGGSAPSNMVTTDTEQTITGNKTFTGNMITFGDYWANNEISVNFNKAKIIANSGIDADSQLCISSGDGGPRFTNSSDKVTFDIPQYLRVFDTVNNVWTNTYKYTYLAKGANGNITLAISDTPPTDMEGGHSGGAEI